MLQKVELLLRSYIKNPLLLWCKVASFWIVVYSLYQRCGFKVTQSCTVVILGVLFRLVKDIKSHMMELFNTLGDSITMVRLCWI